LSTTLLGPSRALGLSGALLWWPAAAVGAVGRGLWMPGGGPGLGWRPCSRGGRWSRVPVGPLLRSRGRRGVAGGCTLLSPPLHLALGGVLCDAAVRKPFCGGMARPVGGAGDELGVGAPGRGSPRLPGPATLRGCCRRGLALRPLPDLYGGGRCLAGGWDIGESRARPRPCGWRRCPWRRSTSCRRHQMSLLSPVAGLHLRAQLARLAVGARSCFRVFSFTPSPLLRLSIPLSPRLLIHGISWVVQLPTDPGVVG
jgi:hypothetical protein